MHFFYFAGDHTACLWDITESAPKRVLTFSNHTRSVKTAVFRPSEPSVFASGARDGHVLVWDIRSPVSSAALVLKPDNSIMSCHSSFTPKTPGSSSKRPRIDTHRAISITGLVFQDDLTLISCGECDGNIKVWDLRKNYTVYKREPLPKHSIPYCGSSTRNGYTNLLIDDARVRLYASCMDGVIYCFNVSTYSAVPERRYVGHDSGSFYIKAGLNADCTYLASGSSDRAAYVWSTRNSRPLIKLNGHRAEVTCAAWCKTGDAKLVTCGDDARHYIWRIGRESPDRDLIGESGEFPGRAEAVPEPPSRPPDRTPASRAKRPRLEYNKQERRGKRCLADLLNASKEPDDTETCVKKLKLDTPITTSNDDDRLLPAGIKRQRPSTDQTTPPKKKYVEQDTVNTVNDWTYYSPRPGTSFMTPTKNYEKKNCKLLSPKSPKTISPKRTPIKVSPTKVRIISFTTPTKDLPDFVSTGEAPHLRLMSPGKKKQDTTNWLTLMLREKKGKITETDKVFPPLSPKENIPVRRNSVTEKTPKANKARTLLKYFSVAPKNK